MPNIVCDLFDPLGPSSRGGGVQVGLDGGIMVPHAPGMGRSWGYNPAIAPDTGSDLDRR